MLLVQSPLIISGRKNKILSRLGGVCVCVRDVPSILTT